jgi:tetratricopeptide (TPR) repeat protein
VQDPVELPPRFGEHLKEKVRLLSEDLRQAPDHPVLLTRLAEADLYLAVLYRERNRREAARWLREAAVPAMKLRGTPEGAGLEKDLRAWERLAWSRNTTATLATQSWSASGAGRVFGRGFVRENDLEPGPVPGQVMPGMPGGPAGLNGPHEVSAPPSGSASNGPDSLSVWRIPPRLQAAPTPPAAGIQALDEKIQALRRTALEKPGDVAAADALARRLAERAQTRTRPQPAALQPNPRGAYLEEAARVYLRTASRTPLRIYQATCYKAAGELYSLMGEPEKEYEMLREAARRVPYSPVVWQELQAACLRTGRYRESRTARKQLVEWTFPGLRPR